LPFAKIMRRNRFCLGFGQTAQAVTTTFAILLVLFLGAVAVSPSLHQRLHADNDRPDHFCVVSAFAGGQLRWTESNLVVAIAHVFLVFSFSLHETPLASCLDFYSSPNRAPPPV
jgi:hypothetical protein